MNRLCALPVLSLGLVLAACATTEPRAPAPRAIEDGLKSVPYATGSTLVYLPAVVEPGFRVELDGNDRSPTEITQPGYLVFIDEQPDFDWAHAAKMVLVPAGRSGPATVLYDGVMIPSFRVLDRQGKPIHEKWKPL